jgi:zinc protease
MTIGGADDLRAMELDDVREFLQTYYHPANASLAIAGDIDSARAFDLAERYFGELPAGPAVPRMQATASLQAEGRLLLEDRIEMPRLYIAWHTPAMFADGDAEMDLIADLIANGKTSRLYRALVYEERMALVVSSFQQSRELGSYFVLTVTATPGRPLTEIMERVDAEMGQFLNGGPSASEMERALAQAEAHFVYRLQTIGGFGGKSDQLNAYNVFLGDPGFFVADLERYRRATEDSLLQAARQYLRADRRIVLSVVPRDQRALGLPDSLPVSVS